jgi:hypothetical protein
MIKSKNFKRKKNLSFGILNNSVDNYECSAQTQKHRFGFLQNQEIIRGFKE